MGGNYRRNAYFLRHSTYKMIERNHVYNMDCRDGLREMSRGGVFVDAVITDPPYLINYFSHHRQDKTHKFCKPIENDDNPQIIIDTIPLIYDVMKPDTPIYMFCGSDKVDFFKSEIEKFFTVKNLIVWDKGNHTAGDLDAQYGKSYEFIIYANKGRAPFMPDARRFEDIWRIPRVSGKEQIHQNQKPQNLLRRIIIQHTKPHDLILDPFAGSMSTAVAAYNLQRDYIGFELSPEIYAEGAAWLEREKRQISIFDILSNQTKK